MTELNVRIVIDNKTVQVPYTAITTAEDVCTTLCKQLGIGTVARHIFALREHSKNVYLMSAATFEGKMPVYDLRIRFKVAQVLRLKKVDIKAYDYYFHQARNDVLENKVPELPFEKYRRELVGLGVTDMYRVMLEKDIPRETVESDYKKYIPKEVLKRHQFFIKKPIHDTLGKIWKSGHDAWYVKEEYLKQLEMMVPDYPFEEYKALLDQNGSVCNIHVRVTPYHSTEPGVKYCFESKREKWFQICTIDELGNISIRKDCTVELSRRNGIPFYLKFSSLSNMYSFVGLLDGYYRLTSKWTFNICKDVPTPSLQRLYSMKCHGPVGGEFSYAKLEEKRSNRAGCFIVRESEAKYNIYFLDVCMKDSLKPKTYKLERLSGDEFIFNDDLTRYSSLAQLMTSYNDPQGPIYLAECLPPSEYDKSPLLLCKRSHISGDSSADDAEEATMPTNPICINTKDLQVYKDVNCLKWNKKRKMVKVNSTFIRLEKFNKYKFPDESLGSAKKYCRNPDGDLAGPWCFVEIEHGSEVEKMYCDIPFCDGQDCNILSRSPPIYTDYISFPGAMTNFSFGVKLWDPDSFLEAKAKLVLSLLPLPVSGAELEDLGVGIEIVLTNKKSALTIGNKDEPEYESTNAILKSTEYTFFSLAWDHGFITLHRTNQTKPVFLQEYKTKHNLMGFRKDQFHFYSAMGSNILWSFPFCEDNGECDVHTTGSSKPQNFMFLREKSVGYDLTFHVRAVHSALILLVPSPLLDFPNIKVLLGNPEGMTRIVSTEYVGGPTVTLKEASYPKLISYWKWSSISLSFFSEVLQLYWTRDVGTFMIMEVKHEIVKSLRWFSPASPNNLAHWTFYCSPPELANPLPAYLPECALNERETSYIGTQASTHEGLPCIPWSAQKFIPAIIHDFYKDPKELLGMYNYCRDPRHEKTGTYCYAISETSEKRIDKHFCKLRKCKSAECKMAGTGNDFIGKLNRTRSNRTCQFWITSVPQETDHLMDDNKNSHPIFEGSSNDPKVGHTSNNNSNIEHFSTSSESNYFIEKSNENYGNVENTRDNQSNINRSSETGNLKKRSRNVENTSKHYIQDNDDLDDDQNSTETNDNLSTENYNLQNASRFHPGTNNSKQNIFPIQTQNVSMNSGVGIPHHNNTHFVGGVHYNNETIGSGKSANEETKVDLVSEIRNISQAVNDFIQQAPHVDRSKMAMVHPVNETYLNGTLFADMSAERAENFCRNPTRSLAGSWCYTTDKDVTQEACYVPDCDKNEECTVLVKGEGHGRYVYILPQWKESGMHGGIRFSVKQWDPDLLEGLEFEFYPMNRSESIKLVIGAENNEKIILYRKNVILQTKTLPRIIPAGKWVSLWLQMRRGELYLGFEGLSTTLFEWISPDKEKEFLPMFVNYMSVSGYLVGVFFACDQYQIENTTTRHFDKFMPLNIWTENDQIVAKNLTLYIRGNGVVRVKLVNLPGSEDNHVLRIKGSKIAFIRNRMHNAETLLETESLKHILYIDSWIVFNVTFTEKLFNVNANGTNILSYQSSIPLLFYYFSVAVGTDNSWVTWVANQEPFEIDGAPKDGGWSRWSPWVCSVSCGGGDGYRTRTCSNPRPNIFGQLCHGSPTTTGKCNDFECGDVNPDTFELIRHHLEKSNLSYVKHEGKPVRLRNNEEIINKITTESPESYYDWIFNGIPIVLETGRVEFLGDDVNFRKAQVNDSGVYVCMLYRINEQRLIFHVVTLAVIPAKHTLITRETLPMNLQCKGLSLGYAYSDLSQKWMLNSSVFINHGTTTLAAVSNEYIKQANKSLSGIWKCIIEQKELKLLWVTNIISVNVRKAPNFYTHLMEDPFTKPIFGKLKSDTAINIVLVVIIILVFVLIAFGAFVYLKWCRLPEQYTKPDKKQRKRNRRFDK